jgi:O-antigen ligase
MKTSSNILLYLFAALYLVVHFVPDLDGADVMGAQWLYTSCIDILVLAYIAYNYKEYQDGIKGIFKVRFTLLYTLFLLWALASYFYAINGIEALVCLSRLVSTFLIFTNLSILFYKKEVKSVFLQLSLFISLVLLYDGFAVIKGFSEKVGDMSLDTLVLSLMGNNGNKNVMAASLLIKFPFAVYYLLNSKIAGRVLGLISLFVGVFALFILNTRSTFVGLFLILVIFSLSTLYFKRKSNKKSIAIQLALFIVPVIIAFFAANMVLENAIKIQGVQGGYGTVTKRIEDISIAKGSDRIHLWSAAIDYFSKHPILGGGYGNWKLASIPYEKEFTNDLFVPYHSHNDFIETFADLGIIGGVLYASLFLMVLLFTIRIWRNEKLKECHLMATIGFMGITCYFVDAFLNFPTERTAMQTMFAFSAALVFAPHFLFENNEQATKAAIKKWAPKIFLVFCFAILLPSIYINQQVYKSLKVQKYVMGEIDADPKMALDDVKDAFPTFPNLSTSTLPIPALVARYYFRDKQYDDAMRLLNESQNINPALHYNDFIKTAVFAAKENFDSVAFYAKRAFYNWPRATSYYKNVIFAASRKKDTAEINKAFATYVKYRNEPEAWNQFLLGRFELLGPNNPYSLKMLDSALKLFPKDTTTFVKIRGLFASGGAAIAPAANDYSTLGVQAFQKGKFTTAAEFYQKASAADPNNYTHVENIGICYYSSKQYEKAITYFDKAATLPQSNTGKSEFFKAMCLISLGKKDQACGALQLAKQKHYPNVDQYIAANCK